MARYDTAVIGGGMVGLWSALLLARAGQSVVVVEAQSVGRHASSASAGGVRSLNRHPAEIALARAALPLWKSAASDLGNDVGFQETGQIRVAEDEAALVRLEQRVEMVKALGFTHEHLVGTNTLFAKEPHLARHCLGALVVEDDGFADPLKTIHALHHAARTAGVTIMEDTKVTGLVGGAPLIIHAGDEIAADTVINAAGAWGAQVAALAGENVNLTPTALQMLVTAPMAPFVSAVMGTEGRKLSLKQSSAGHVIIGGGFTGTIDGEGLSARPQHAAIAQNAANAANLFPHLKEHRIVRSWCGIEGMTPDGLPIVSPSRTMPGLIHAFGFCGHGFALAPVTAQLVQSLAAGNTPHWPLEPFNVARFEAAAEGRIDA